MTMPRPIEPGTTYMVTRRCTQRMFLLVPRGRVHDIVAYCLGWAAAKHGILLHAVVVMSNHYHLVLTDVEGRLPAFTRDFHSLVARAVNACLGRWENLFATEQTSHVELANEEDVVAKMAYVLTNPVAAGLVRDHRQWPGLHSVAESWLLPARVVPRPAGFFAVGGDTAESVELRFVPPPGVEAGERAGFVARVRAAVERRERELVAQAVAEGRGFLGPRGVQKQPVNGRPATAEERRGLSPTVAAMDREARVRLLQAYEAFRRGYREALLAWRGGRRDVEFPWGTYQMKVEHEARCTGPPDPPVMAA